MNEFDEGVILRAHRFRAESVGYRLGRGYYMDGEDEPSGPVVHGALDP